MIVLRETETVDVHASVPRSVNLLLVFFSFFVLVFTSTAVIFPLHYKTQKTVPAQ